jgi:undecaprenyl-diphosphatase
MQQSCRAVARERKHNQPMTLIEALVLGVVQGLTEFLPISSSAHLRVVPSLVGWSDPGAAYSAVIQLGSVIAVLSYFLKDLVGIFGGFFKALKEKDYLANDVRLVAAVFVGTIPVCVIGLAFRHVIEGEGVRSLFVIGTASIVMGLLLLLAEKIGSRTRSLAELGVRDGLLVGLAQACALVPGCSRSGSTLTAALLLSIKREDAARFSFLLGIPAIVLSGLLELKKMLDAGLNTASTSSLLAGLAVSTVVSYLSIWWLLNFLRSHSTAVFVAYRLIFGVAVVALAAAGSIH